MKVGLIARADRTGLGNQTRSLMRMLNPDSVIVIDSTPFNGNEQDFTPFKQYNAVVNTGLLEYETIESWLEGLDVVISCETFYNNEFTKIARRMGVKTVLQPNWEFFDWNLETHRTWFPLPDVLLIPSPWHLEDFKKFANFDTKVFYLPPPIFVDDFKRIQTTEVKPMHKPRLLHNAGKIAHLDRNGTQTLLSSIKKVKGNFELVIKVQNVNGSNLVCDDPRVTFDYSDVKDETRMYEGFDFMVLPRRYAGLCLPMLEAMASGLPVIMTDISPNNQQLPAEWLATAQKATTFMGRSEIDVYAADVDSLVERIEFMLDNLETEKQKVYNIIQTYSNTALFDKYITVLEGLVNG